MKILQLVTRRQRRGAEVFASQLSDTLARRGREVVLVGLYPPPLDALVPSSAAVQDLACDHGVGKLSWRRVKDLAALIRANRPDVVQANGSDTLKYTALVKRLYGGGWPLVYRNISVASHWLRYPGHRLWQKWLLGRVDHVAAVSQESREDFQRTYGTRSDQITTIPIGTTIPVNPAQGSARDQLLALTGMPPQSEVVIHVGSFSPEKNHRWLLEAFVAIRRRRTDARLVLIGDGPLRPAVEAAVHQKGLSGCVRLLGSRADAPELVGGADVMVLPSLIEGIPGVILEAGAQAVPAVANDVGGIKESLQHGETGMLVPVGDREAFVSAVVALLGDPARRREMGRAARQLIQQHYDMEKVVDAFEDLYRQLIRAREG